MNKIIIILAVAASWLAPWLATAKAETDAPAAIERMLHAGPAARATLSDPASIEPFLDGYAASLMTDQFPPGMMVAVATRDAVFLKAYGTADMDAATKATPETLFRIASISKTFIWTTAIMLADEGRLDLDADVNTYLKSYKVKPKFGAPVTMNDLMAHRGGFDDSFGVYFANRFGDTPEEALAETAPKRIAPPGTRTSYSNWGSALAAQVIADIEGKPFDEVVAARILTPLGMTSTTQHDPKAVAAKPRNDPALDTRLARGHKLENGAVVTIPYDSLDPLHAPGNIALDAHDAARFMQFLLNDGVAGGKRLLSPQAFTEMRLRAFPDRTGAPDFAHGFMETEIAGARTFGHGGALSGFYSDMTLAPALGLGVFVVINGADASAIPGLVSRAVIEAFAGSPDMWPRPWTVEATDAMKAKAKSAAGTYLPVRHVEKRFEKLIALSSAVTIKANDDGTLLFAIGDKKFLYYPLAEDLYTDRARDRLFVYRNDDGSVKRISYGKGTDVLEPVAFLASPMAFNLAIGLAALFAQMALIAAWRRQGRDVATTSAGKWLSLGHAVIAIVFLVFIGTIVAVTGSLQGKELSELQAVGWPPPALVVLIVVANVTALAGLAAAAGVFPVITRSGWSLWRKAHYAMFAAVGLFLVFELFEWRLVLAPISR